MPAMIYCNLKLARLYAGAMATQPISTRRLDRIAIGLSALCTVHCLGTAVLLTLVASAGGLLGQPIIHHVGLALAVVLGAAALIQGRREHGLMLPSVVGATGLALMAIGLTLHDAGYEPLLTVIGVSVLALGHRLNMRAANG